MTDAENSLLVEHYPLVGKVVNRMMARLPRHIDADDLHSAGVAGLVKAAQRYKPERCQFTSYAEMVVRGAILDELRRFDTCPRRLRTFSKSAKRAVCAVEQRNGRAATDAEISAELGMSAEKYAKYTSELARRGRPPLSIDAELSEDFNTLHAILIDDDDVTGRENLEREEQMRWLTQQIAKLPERHRKIVALRFADGLNLAEIAAVLGVSEARISQLVLQIIFWLKSSVAKASLR